MRWMWATLVVAALALGGCDSGIDVSGVSGGGSSSDDGGSSGDGGGDDGGSSDGGSSDDGGGGGIASWFGGGDAATTDDGGGSSEPEPGGDAAEKAMVEAAVVETIEMTRDGEFDAWIAKYCDPKRCHNENAKGSWKTYQLPEAQRFGKMCLFDGKLDVARYTNKDPRSGQGNQIFVNCKGRQLPVPVRYRIIEDPDKRVVINTLSF